MHRMSLQEGSGYFVADGLEFGGGAREEVEEAISIDEWRRFATFELL